MPAMNAPRNAIPMKVTVRYVVAPDADARLSRAIDMMMENATRKQKPSAPDSRKQSFEKPCAPISDERGRGGKKS